jgi:hypothetical protein
MMTLARFNAPCLLLYQHIFNQTGQLQTDNFRRALPLEEFSSLLSYSLTKFSVVPEPANGLGNSLAASHLTEDRVLAVF